MDVDLSSHMPRSHASAMSHANSSSDVWDWLCVLRLEQYSAAFHRAGLATLRQCRNLTADQLGSMGVTLPGHQRRILASLSKTHAQDGRDTHREKELQRESSSPCPAEATQMALGDPEVSKPAPREGEKPVPKERQVCRLKEEEGGTKVPLPERRQTSPINEKKEEGEEERERPVPKERTKYRCSAPVKTRPSPVSPPVPPRITPNCPPQRFTSAPSPPVSPPKVDRHDVQAPAAHRMSRSQTSTSSSTRTAARTQPQMLGIQPHAQHLVTDGGRKTSASINGDRMAPPLPPKVGGSKSLSPIPQCIPAQSSRSNSSSPTKTSADEIEKDQAPLVPPRIKTSQTHENLQPPARHDTQPVLPTRKAPQPPQDIALDSADDDSDEYEDPDREMLKQVSNCAKGSYNSWLSDDELENDAPTALPDENPRSTSDSVYLPDIGRRGSAPAEDILQFTVVIKMGWLHKSPPPGRHSNYQRRLVKLDADYLRYFDSAKQVYSKGFISTAFITNLSSVGELKFEVATNNRTFIFKAESEAERNDWLKALQDCTRGRSRSSKTGPSSPPTPEYQGYLDLKGLRHKLYTVVASDKVFLYKNIDDFRLGVGVTSIEMNVGNVKDSDRRSFELTTPYRIFSFIAESEQQRELWVDAMRNAIGEALSNSEVAEQIWAEPSNISCADCGAPKPDWAAINLCVVICKQCAGEHRGLGPSISKVRSLKMDRKIWTGELIQVFLLLGNERANSFWAANVPPSEALSPSSGSDERRNFITNKYRQGKYRKYHLLFGNQEALNNALCLNVQGSDLLETLSLIFCGADVNCSTGMTNTPSPLSLAKEHSQPYQAELLSHNLHTELPHSEVGGAMEPVHYSAQSCVSHNGFLYKTASMSRTSEHKAREEFSRRWCTLNDGTFSYYENDKNANPNGTLKTSDMVCLAVTAPEKHGYEHSFELYTSSQRLYLFGTDDADSHKEWVKSIARSFIPPTAEPLLRMDFERIGRLKCKDGLNLQTSKDGWFVLVGSTLHASLNKGQWEEINLRKLNELSTQQDNEVLVLVERGRTLYIEGERKLDFSGWCAAIRSAAQSGGDTLSEQQLTETDIPVIVHSCIGYITQCGLTSEGIYRKSGVNSRVGELCKKFRIDARSIRLKEGDHQVDDVSNTLKRFFRELGEGLFTSQDAKSWLGAAAIQDENMKISQYQQLLNRLPDVNKATLQALINHLYCVQRHSKYNQMTLENLAIVFGPTLFQIDGQDNTALRTIEDLIQHYIRIFEVDEEQLKNQLKEIKFIINMRITPHPSTERGGDFICTVYLEQRRSDTEQHVKIPGSMTAGELICEVLHRRNIPVRDREYWCCWEVSNTEEMERPLHYQDRVLPIFHAMGTEFHLLIRVHVALESMLNYLSRKTDASKHGTMKFSQERGILSLSSGFHDRYFVLSSSSLRMYNKVTSHSPEREWEVNNLKIFIGIKKKLHPPTCWGLTVYESKKPERKEKQQWYLCCDTMSEMREWYASFLSAQYNGDIWPEDGLRPTRVSHVPTDARHGNVSLIPLRGSENEMRNSVAAFSQDPLSIFRDLR